MTPDGIEPLIESWEAPARAGSRDLSVVIPVHQGGSEFSRVLKALVQSELPRNSWELIVIDDASTDESQTVAAAYADLVIRLNGRPRGPAYARNRGFEAARGSFVAFIDADVLVHPLALSRMLDAVRGGETIGAIVGSYDALKTSNHLVSEYRNLVRHFEHQSHTGDTDAFTAGLALVRREALLRAGMFDEWRFQRPQAEALELGDRLHSLGYRIVRCADVQATHLKRWTLRSWIGIDILDRGMAVARLSHFPSLRKRADRLYVASSLDALLGWIVLTFLTIALVQASVLFATAAAAALAALTLHNLKLFRSFAVARGVGFAIAVIPLHALTCTLYGVASVLGRLQYHAIGESQPDPVVQAFAEVGARTWPPIPTRPTLGVLQATPRRDSARRSV